MPISESLRSDHNLLSAAEHPKRPYPSAPTARVLADRMACLKAGVVANVVVPTPDYVRLAGHYGFVPDFCHVHDPQSKGIAEHLCGYPQRDFAVPLLTRAAVDGVAVDIRSADTAAGAWCAEVNALVRDPGDTRRRADR